MRAPCLCVSLDQRSRLWRWEGRRSKYYTWAKLLFRRGYNAYKANELNAERIKTISEHLNYEVPPPPPSHTPALPARPRPNHPSSPEDLPAQADHLPSGRQRLLGAVQRARSSVLLEVPPGAPPPQAIVQYSGLDDNDLLYFSYTNQVPRLR